MLMQEVFEADLQFAIRRMFDGCEVYIRDLAYARSITPTGDGRGPATGSFTVTCMAQEATTCQQLLERYGPVTVGQTGETMEFYLVAHRDTPQ